MILRRSKAANGLFGIKLKVTQHLIINSNLQYIQIFMINDEVQKNFGGAYSNFLET